MSRLRRRAALAVAAAGVVVAGLVLGVLAWPQATSVSAEQPARKAKPTVSIDRTLAKGLVSPWGLAFLPDGSALVGERDTGRVLRVPADGGSATPVGRVQGVRPSGEGGLLGLAVPPGRAPRYVFAYYTSDRDNRVVRIAWNGKRLGAQRPILTGIPSASFHDGGRLLVAPDRTLVVATGDAGDPDRAQDPASLAGKVLRVTFSGRPAPGNPDPDSVVYSLGHRNVQGLAADSRGRVWASEFGAKDADELNLLRPGRNYGWPRYEGSAGAKGFVDPFTEWSPTSIASPSGLAILDDVAYVASLRGERLWQVPLTGARAGQATRVDLGDLGRLRTVATAPDGSLWLVTSNTDGRGDPRRGDDRILRLVVEDR